MKKLIFLFIMLQSVAFGQYKSMFGQHQTSWNVYYLTNFSYSVNDSSYFKKDTVVNNLTYKIIASGSCAETWILEDTTQGKAWGVNPITHLVTDLIYDLNLNIGDTYQLPMMNIAGTVDSIYYINGLKHLRLIPLSFTTKSFYMIEGLGLSVGFLKYGGAILNGYKTLLCHRKDFTLNYSWGGPCVYTIAGIDELNEQTIKTSPNPVTDQLNITLPEGKHILEAEILNTLGQTVMSFKNIDASLDVSGLESGVYFLRLKGENANYLRQLVKQ